MDLQDSFSDNDDSYNEIELDPLAEATKCFNYNEDDKISNQNSEEHELRISISSTIPLPQAETSTAHPSLLISCTTSTNNSGTFTDSPLTHSTLSQTDQLTVLDAYNNMALRYSSSTRKQASMRIRNGGTSMMKLLIKFRAIKLGTLLASLVKPRGTATCSQDKKPSRSKCRTSILQCYEKSNPWEPELDQRSSRVIAKRDEARKNKHWDLDKNKRSHASSSSMVEIDLGALRGIFSVLCIAHKRSSKRNSCSTSCDTSPIHQPFSLSSSDNSIQAAIAYCKTSCGQTSEFSF